MISRRLSRRALALLTAAVLAVAAVTLLATGAFSGSSSPSAATIDNGFPTAIATVRQRPLSSQMLVSATLEYAGASTVVLPAGTAPSAVAQAQQSATSAESQLAMARSTLATDTRALAATEASLAGGRAKLAVDCAGDNAGAAAPAAGSGSSPCANDAQALSAGEQAESQDRTKVTSDNQSVSTAQTGLAAAQASFTEAQSSATAYGQSSTYTALPAVGRIVDRGQTLLGIGGQPVVVLYGSVAPWRTFGAGMSPGTDVAELNANLDALGEGHGLSGNAFTAATAAAIDAFQSARGLAPTGELLLGSVVFEPGPVRVTSVTPTLGATAQAGPVLGVTSTTREVVIELDAAQQADLKVGDPVTITLPDNSTTPGKVTYVGTVATVPSGSGDGPGGGSGTPTIEVDVTPTDPAATGHLDQAPVNVSITTASVKSALVVPVNALLALASGGYALEEVGAGSVHHLVGVELGLFDDADGLVQVTGGGLAPGQRVVVPNT